MRRQPKTAKKTVKEPVVIVRIVPGTPTPTARASWRKLFARLICDYRVELGSEAKGNDEQCRCR